MPVSLLITGYYRHPKMMAANRISGGELAEVLWCRGLDYVNEHGTDGFIPAGVPPLLCPTKTAARVRGLVEAGLWDESDDGWRVHDYDQWNRRAAELAARQKEISEARSRAGRKGAAVRWGGKVHRPDDGKCHSKGMANGWQADSPGPGPGPGVGSYLDLEVEVDVREPRDHFPDDAPQRARPALRAVDAPPCKHDDPHPELCQLCAAERRRRTA